MGRRKPRGASAEVAGGMINIARNVFFFVFLRIFYFPFLSFPTYGRMHTSGAAFGNASYQQVAKIQILPLLNEINSHSTPLDIVSRLGVYTLWAKFETATIFKSFSATIENKKPRNKKHNCLTYIQKHRVRFQRV